MFRCFARKISKRDDPMGRPIPNYVPGLACDQDTVCEENSMILEAPILLIQVLIEASESVPASSNGTS